MIEIPPGWTRYPLQALVTMNEKHEKIDDHIVCGFVPMNLMPTKLLEKIQFEKKKWNECKKGYTQFKDGDVLLAKITPCFENGKSAVAYGLPNGIGAGSTEYFVLRSEILDSRYLHAFVKTKKFKDDCTVRMSGSVGHKRVPKDYLLAYPIPIAPANEQTRIANKLDSLLAKVDLAQTRLEKIPTLLKRFRQAVLVAATSGELTKEWREGKHDVKNPIIELQKSKRKWIEENESHNEAHRVRKRVNEFSIKDLMSDNLPEGWCWGELEDCVLMIVDCHNKTAPYVDSGIPLIRTSNIREGGFIWDELRYVDEETYKFWSRRSFPEPGDIIFTREAPMGEAAIIPEGLNVCLGQRTMLLKPIPDYVLTKYLLLSIMDPRFKKRSATLAVGTGVKHYRVGDVSNLKVSIPPTNEQIEIVQRVESLFAMADTVEKQYSEAKKRINRLTQSLLAKAFRGELVPQDPNDEPASELLKRIQTEREKKTEAKPKRIIKAKKK